MERQKSEGKCISVSKHVDSYRSAKRISFSAIYLRFLFDFLTQSTTYTMQMFALFVFEARTAFVDKIKSTTMRKMIYSHIFICFCCHIIISGRNKVYKEQQAVHIVPMNKRNYTSDCATLIYLNRPNCMGAWRTANRCTRVRLSVHFMSDRHASCSR